MAADDAKEKKHEMMEVPGFELYERLGEGTMGVVFRARHQFTDQIVALKVLYPILAGNVTYLERFRAEAEAAVHLDHPNLVRVHGFGQRGLTYFICMEYVEGINLRDLLAREGALDELTVIVIGMCVASALHYAWEKSRLIHRDVKPENLLISKDGRLKLCDMGIAKRMVPQPVDKSLTRTGYVVGTPHYIAPEQLKGGKELDCRVDIYALGATLYNAATGHTIHQADNMFSLLMKQASEPARDPREIMPGLDDAFCKLLLQMLDLDREKRPANWTVVYDELAAIHERLTLARMSAPIRISSAERVETQTPGATA
ncbi:MAG: serine/threonine protein kinase [Verrucomicrobiae bacterium]|nr:serine/threonine protein kinase [Verrucomicrobiae bacterium]